MKSPEELPDGAELASNLDRFVRMGGRLGDLPGKKLKDPVYHVTKYSGLLGKARFRVDYALRVASLIIYVAKGGYF